MKIAVIGGGLSGSSVIINLMRQAEGPVTIYLFEKSSAQFNKGVAYSSQLPYQLLNVAVKDMSLLPDVPNHFDEWLKKHGYNYSPADFAPRYLYGKYIEDTFDSEAKAHKECELNIIRSEAKGVEKAGYIYKIHYDKDRVIEATKVILCTGNFPPGDVPGLPAEVKQNKGYISHPWGGFNVNSLSSRENILMVGSGLTMLDLVLSLNYNDHIGKIVVISRRGLLPLPHGDSPAYKLSVIPQGNLTVVQLLDWVKHEVKLAESRGMNWRSVIDALRPHIQDLWNRLNTEERKRFMRHLRPFWEIHRHKMPVESLAILNRMKNDGRLEILAGRIQNAELSGDDIKVTYRCRNSKELKYITVNHIINCTGPETEYRKLRSPLYQSLIENKIAQPDELSLGLMATTEGFVIEPNGSINRNVALVGPPAKGALWECTALREIRLQAAQVVKAMLAADGKLQGK